MYVRLPKIGNVNIGALVLALRHRQFMELTKENGACKHHVPNSCIIQRPFPHKTNQVSNKRNIGMRNGRLPSIDLYATEIGYQSRYDRCQRENANEAAANDGHSVAGATGSP